MQATIRSELDKSSRCMRMCISEMKSQVDLIHTVISIKEPEERDLDYNSHTNRNGYPVKPI